MKKLDILQNILQQWEFFCYDYSSTTKDGLTYPEMIDKIRWENCDAEYMRNKWAKVCAKYGCEGTEALHMLFIELDTENQRALLKYAFTEYL